MTGFNNNNEFKPNLPKTYTVIELRDQQQGQQSIKKSPLSTAARSKVVNRSGSNYLSENKGYGPCLLGSSGCSVTAILIDTDGHSRSDTLYRPVEFGQGGLYPWIGNIESGWGIWEDRYYIVHDANSFKPSYRARRTLVEEILKVKDQCGHKTVAVTDKREWR
jgi:hypothetical protein